MCRKMLCAVVAMFAVGLPLVIAVPAARADSAGDLFTMINNLRAGIGLPALVSDPTLTAAAQQWSAQMASNRVLADATNLSSQVPVGWSKLGENVGAGGNVQQIFDALRNNPGHYALMTDPAFTLTGVAVAATSDGSVLYASEFLEARRAVATTTTGAKPTTTSTHATTTTSSSPATTTTTVVSSTTTATTTVSTNAATTTTSTGSTIALGPVRRAGHSVSPWIFVGAAAAVALAGLILAGIKMRARPGQR